MIVSPLGSGSAGNSYLFESDGTALLVDAGFGPRETEKRLRSIDRTLEHIRAIVITHEHYDHIHGAEKIAKKYGIPLYMTKGTLDASGIDPEGTPLAIFENNTTFRIGDLQVHARRVIHDAADPACFVIESVDGTRVGVASDLGYVDDPVLRHLTNCDGLLFESNHDVDMLREGSYPWSLKRRIMSRYGHLSNDEAMRALERMIGAETRSVYLIHLSEKNNHSTIVRDMATQVVNRLGAPIEVAIAAQRETSLLTLTRRHVPPPRPSAAQLTLF